MGRTDAVCCMQMGSCFKKISKSAFSDAARYSNEKKLVQPVRVHMSVSVSVCVCVCV